MLIQCNKGCQTCPKDTNFCIARYSDVGYTGNANDMESTISAYIYQRKQKLNSLSNVKAEYIIVGSCCP